MRIDDDIWPAIRPHAWKWQEGRVDVVGIIAHATRSGISNRTGAQEYGSTLNWFRSPDNAVRDSAGNKWFGGMSSYVVGGGRVCRAVPEEFVPRFSAGIHDFRAISIELAQGTNGTPYEPRDIELFSELVDDIKSRNKGITTLARILFVDGNNVGWPGIVGHEDTAQGRGQGKSDPGLLFWTAYTNFRELEADMTENQVKALIAAALAEREQAEVAVLGSTQLQATEALVKRSRAMAKAKSLNDIIAANNPGVVPE